MYVVALRAARAREDGGAHGAQVVYSSCNVAIGKYNTLCMVAVGLQYGIIYGGAHRAPKVTATSPPSRA
eukprot:3184772-Alexandrium_andersonii.AAC.1